MEAAPVSYRLFVGIDIAAASFVVVRCTPGPSGTSTSPSTLPQTPAGFATLQQRLHATGLPAASILVVMEATGSYWMRLATSLVADGFVVSVINPSQAHAFARALLKRAKTDAIDAETLAHLAALLQPHPWTPPPTFYTELQQRLAQRDAFLNLRQQLRNQLHALQQQPVVVAPGRRRETVQKSAMPGALVLALTGAVSSCALVCPRCRMCKDFIGLVGLWNHLTENTVSRVLWASAIPTYETVLLCASAVLPVDLTCH